MSEKEKTAIWIEQQRQGLIDQSQALEAELRREKEAETGKTAELELRKLEHA